MSSQATTDNPKNSLRIALIIPTFRRGPYLLNTLRALLRQTRLADEILVIDQTPLEEYDATVIESLESGSQKGDFRWIRLPEPSVSKARNQAVLETECDVLLYLDDDIEPAHNLVEAHLKHYQNPEVHAVVGTVLRSRDQELLTPPVDFATRGIVEQAFTYRDRFDRRMISVGFMWAGNFSVRRDALIAVEGWDEHIINYGDRDLGIRLAMGGYRIDYDPEAYIIHFNAPMGGTSVTDKTSPWQGWQRCVSIFYLGFRHLQGRMFLRYAVYRAARFSLLLKQNAIRPWRWPGEVYSYVKAFLVAWRWAKEGVSSPFLSRTSQTNYR